MTRQHTLYALLLAALATLALVTPIAVLALMMDKGTYGYRKSGQPVTNVKHAKRTAAENKSFPESHPCLPSAAI
jgi:hypothetical protein